MDFKEGDKVKVIAGAHIGLYGKVYVVAGGMVKVTISDEGKLKQVWLWPEKIEKA